MMLDAAAGHVVVQKLSITRGNCAGLVGNEVGAGFALMLVLEVLIASDFCHACMLFLQASIKRDNDKSKHGGVTNHGTT